jgi:membrane-bound lytic murein transglycosylase A
MKKFIYICGIFLIFSTLCQAEPKLNKADFKQLIDWEKDNHLSALVAFKQSCTEILKRHPAFFGHSIQVPTHAWQRVCKIAFSLQHPTQKQAKHFFETEFRPYYVSEDGEGRGLFTGYYLPVLQGRLHKDKQHQIPIYGMPPNLVKVDLGTLDKRYAGRMVTGQLIAKHFAPYPTRAAINAGLIPKATPVLAWASSAIDVFFAQIQGSALVNLPHHQQVLIGYAGNNGQPYFSIAKYLIAINALTDEAISMQTLKNWLHSHPKEQNTVMNQNKSFVFFRLLKNNAPYGTEQIPLTPERSLAVDQRFIPLGAPIWLETSMPTPNEEKPFVPYRHLLIAQDTGGAIKGVVRGDVYWGTGDRAAWIAGKMRSIGQYWVLLPRG